MAQRSQFVASDGSASSRNSLTAGRTGTRLNIGSPTCRWEEGVNLARSVLRGRSEALNSAHTLSIGSRIRNAVQHISQFFDVDPG